jgi:beta-mannanase
VVIRYLWEMNSSIASNDRTDCEGPDDASGSFDPVDFIAAWDHLRGRFALDGATNVKWFWCPNDSAATLPPYFPGADQVDFVGVDVYERPPETFGQFSSHVAATYASIEALAPGEPFIFGETAATSPDQVTYFQSLYALYATLPATKAWVYFDATGPLGDWRVQPGTPQFAAFKNLVAP